MTCRYRAYGLTIESDIALPELDEADSGGADLVIRLAAVSGPTPSADNLRLVEFSGRDIYFAWNGLGRISVRDCRHVAVDPVAGLDHAVLGLVLLGPVMAAVLHGRGDIVLHGSSVAVDENRAVVFLGDNGTGKSTLAAACISAGHEIVNDDVIAIVPPSGQILIRRGFPAMKLSRAALDAVMPSPGFVLPATSPDAAKLRLRLPRIKMDPLKLSHIFVLERGADFAVRPLGPSGRLETLMRYSYMPKFGPQGLSGVRASEHFAACAAMADQLAMSVLKVPNSLNALMEMPQAIAKLIADEACATESPE